MEEQFRWNEYIGIKANLFYCRTHASSEAWHMTAEVNRGGLCGRLNGPRGGFQAAVCIRFEEQWHLSNT